MKGTTKRMTMTMAALAIFAATPAFAVDGTGAGKRLPDPDRARELRSQAESLFSQPTKWGKAVRLLEKSAELRQANDPEAYSCFLYAGRIRAALGDLSGARTDLEKAANHAMARGAILDAAHAWVDAAHAAAAMGSADAARELAGKAVLLAESPQLTAAEKELITSRVHAN